MATFRRLLGFLRPYRRAVLGSLVLATLAMAATVAIPWLTGRVIDRVRAGDSAALTHPGRRDRRRRRSCAWR